MATRGPTITETLATLLVERGGQRPEELGAQLVALGRTRARNPELTALRALEIDRRFSVGQDGRWWSLAAQLEGAQFTVAPTTLERDHEFVLVRPDLALVARLLPRTWWSRHGEDIAISSLGEVLQLPWLVDQFEPEDDHWRHPRSARPPRVVLGEAFADEVLGFLADIGESRADSDTALRHLLECMRDDPVIHGPYGWMPGLEPRDELAFRVCEGRLVPVAAGRHHADPARDEAAARRIGDIDHQLRSEATDHSAIVTLEQLLERLAVDDPGVFRPPTSRVSTLLRRAGLKVRGEEVHPARARAA
jgi:hypothetical protein